MLACVAMRFADVPLTVVSLALAVFLPSAECSVDFADGAFQSDFFLNFEPASSLDCMFQRLTVTAAAEADRVSGRAEFCWGRQTWVVR